MKKKSRFGIILLVVMVIACVIMPYSPAKAEGAPVVEGVINMRTYHEPCTITFDKGTATLNGQPFLSGDTVSEEGDYTLIVTDATSGVTTITFYIVDVSFDWQVSGNTLKGIPLGSAVQDVLTGVKMVIGYVTSATNPDGTVSDLWNKAFTGLNVNCIDGEGAVFKTYTVAMTGDVTGDGEVSANDLLGLKKHLLRQSILTNAFLVAANTDGDSNDTVGVLDYLGLKKHLLGRMTLGPAPIPIPQERAIQDLSEFEKIIANGTHLFVLTEKKLDIVTKESQTVAGKYAFENFFETKGMTLYGNRVVIYGVQYEAYSNPKPFRPKVLYWRVLVLDIQNPAQPQVVRDFQAKGWVHYTKRIDHQVFVGFGGTEFRDMSEGDDFLPIQDDVVVDTGLGDSNVFHILRMDLNTPTAIVDMDAYTAGDSDSRLVKGNHVYLVDTRTPYWGGQMSSRLASIGLAMESGKTELLGKIMLPGDMGNPGYNLKEGNDHLYMNWGSYGIADANSGVYILTPSLRVKGFLPSPDITFSEINFYGGKYATADNLVLDFSNPSSPRIAGPITLSGREVGYYKIDDQTFLTMLEGAIGLKDMTDPFNPMLLSTLPLAGYGGDSGPKIFGEEVMEFAPAQGALAFVRETGSLSFPNDVEVYNFSRANGVTFIGEIIHTYIMGSQVSIRACAIMGNTLYTASEYYVKMHDVHTLAETGSVFIGN